MKKINFLILLVMLPLAASAEIIEKNGIWYKMHHQIAGDVYTAEVIASQGNPYSGDITIPQSIYWGETCPVTSIGESAFEGSTGLTSITIPSSIKSIEQGAFYGCSGLTSVRIPEGVTKIGLGAFSVCYNMVSVSIPSSVTSIESYAFDHCTSLSRIISDREQPIDIDNTVFETYDDPYNVYSMATLIVPDGAVSSYQSATGWGRFSNISEVQKVRSIHVAVAGTLAKLISDEEKYRIEELTLTGELNGLDIRFLRNMSGVDYYWEDPYGTLSAALDYYTEGKLAVLDISNAKIVSGGGTFYAYDGSDSRPAKSCTTKENTISSRMFYRCKLTSIVIPNSVTKIESGAFNESGWYNSQSDGILYLDGWLIGYKGEKPSGKISVTQETKGIADNAFSGCSDITSVNIPESVLSIGNYAFYGCSGLTSLTISKGVISIGDYAFSYCSGLSSVNIPNSVISIGFCAFEDCNLLSSVIIPNSVMSIESSIFQRCNGLTTIVVENGNKNYDSRDNCNAIINTASNTLIIGCKNTTIPNSVTSIGNTAFAYCSGLTAVDIPNSVTSIGSQAFSGCSGLTSVTIPNSVISIGSSAFRSCRGLITATISNSVTSLANYVFDGCDRLTSIIIPNSVTTIESDAFWGCTGLTTLIIGKSTTAISSSAFGNCKGLTIICSLNRVPASFYTSGWSGSPSFEYVDKENCVLWVPKGSVMAYKETDGWKDFKNIKELTIGDVNLDDKVNKEDLNATTSHIMGKDPEGFYESLADLNGDEKVNAVDVVKLVDILNIQDGLSNDWQLSFNSSQVVSSLSCTLNNNSGKAIKLTKCELYHNQNLAGYATFNYTLASGGNKKCSFDDLASYAAKSGFSVIWYYTYNGDDNTYKSNLTE